MSLCCYSGLAFLVFARLHISTPHKEGFTMTYTHVFINSTKQMVPMAEAKQAVTSIDTRVSGFVLVDENRVKFDQHGKPCYRSGGWSYGHIQNGYICAGAGGLNSMRVMEI
jgi:hypothetical protein